MTLPMGNRTETRAPRLPGELIVRNGPDRGVSRGLLVPLTLVGSGEACDLRIIDLLVRPVHCVISVTPEGPHLRSVGGSTLVNNTPSTARMLQQGDILTVGPADLEVRWAMPPAPTPGAGAGSPVKLAEEVVPDAMIPEAMPVRKCARLHWKLAQARGRLFRDRQRLLAETNGQREELAAARADGLALHDAARAELDNLRKLRRRFIKRWKRQWAAERQRLTGEAERLTADRAAFDAEKTALEGEHDRTDRDRRQLANALRACRAKRLALETELHARQQELADREHLLNARADALTREQADFAALRSALGHEIVALETRVTNLRESLPLPDATAPAVVPAAESEETVPLHLLADDLDDQRHSLGELVGHVAHTLTAARHMGADTLAELEAILRGVLAREEAVQATTRDLLTEQARLETWQARLLDSQIASDRDADAVAIREDRMARHEDRLRTTMAEWKHRRKTELAAFHGQLQQARLLRDQAAEAIRRADHRETELARRREALAARELAVELARQDLGGADAEALARAERKVSALAASHEARLEEQAARIVQEQAVLADLARQATAQWEALARQQRTLARQQTHFDHREYAAGRERDDEAVTVLQLQADRATADRHAGELRQEVARLVRVVEQLARPAADAKRAA